MNGKGITITLSGISAVLGGIGGYVYAKSKGLTGAKMFGAVALGAGTGYVAMKVGQFGFGLVSGVGKTVIDKTVGK